ncbi:MAG: RNase A-like domain-containing protein [Myxococcota bacterium]
MSQLQGVSAPPSRPVDWAERGSDVRRSNDGDFTLTLGGTDSLDDALKLLEAKMGEANGASAARPLDLPENWESRYAVFVVGQLGREPEPGDVIRVPADPEHVFDAANVTSPELARKARELFKSGQTLTVNSERRKRAHAEKQALARQGPGIAAPAGGVRAGAGVRVGPKALQSKPRAPWTRPVELRAQTAFEKRERLSTTLSRAGMPERVVARIINEGITAEDAQNLADRLLQKPPSLEGFGPRMVTLALLNHVVTLGGPESHPEAPRADLDALYDFTARFEGMVVLRPDGYLSSLSTGKAKRKLGTVVSRPYGYGVGPYPVGVPYIAEGEVFYEIAPDGSKGKGVGYVTSNAETPLAGRVLDGAENAVVATVDGVIEILTAPDDVLQDTFDALGSIPPAQELARWLAKEAPEFVERFKAMPEGDQVEAISTLVSHLFTMGLLARPAIGLGGRASKLFSQRTLHAIPNASGGFALRLGWESAAAGISSGALGEAAGTLGALGILHSSLPDPQSVDRSRAANRERYKLVDDPRAPDQTKKKANPLVRHNPQGEHWVTVDEFLKRHGDIDLLAYEARGGHTIEKHVGKTPEELRDRLNNEPKLRAVSTFTSENEARGVIQRALREHALEIAEWEARSPSGKLEITMPSRKGSVLVRGADSVTPASNAYILLRGDGAGRWTVLTAYPTL